MEEELVLADLAMVNARIEKLEKDLKKMKDPEGEKERELLERLTSFPGRRERRSATFPSRPPKRSSLRSFAFLSHKPLLHMINVDEKDARRLEARRDLRPEPGRRP